MRDETAHLFDGFLQRVRAERGSLVDQFHHFPQRNPRDLSRPRLAGLALLIETKSQGAFSVSNAVQQNLPGQVQLNSRSLRQAASPLSGVLQPEFNLVLTFYGLDNQQRFRNIGVNNSSN